MATGSTIYDIARRAGVGIATVSRVMNGSTRVSEATRSAVRCAMDELGFRPNHAARRLAARAGARPRVAGLMPFSSASFYLGVTRPLAQALAAGDIDLVLHDIKSRDDKNRVLDRIIAERSCEALVVCSMGIGPQRQAQLASRGVPVVSIDYPLDGVASITVDNADGIAQAVAHLRASGARSIALIAGPESALAYREREAAFIAGCGVDAPIVRGNAVTREHGRVACARLLATAPRVDAVIAVSDVLALGALEELRARRIDVPGHIQLIGFDDQPLMDFIGLSTVRQPVQALGEWAAARLREAVAGTRVGADASRRLSVTLIARATTRAAAEPAARAPRRPRHRRRTPAKEST